MCRPSQHLAQLPSSREIFEDHRIPKCENFSIARDDTEKSPMQPGPAADTLLALQIVTIRLTSFRSQLPIMARYSRFCWKVKENVR